MTDKFKEKENWLKRSWKAFKKADWLGKINWILWTKAIIATPFCFIFAFVYNIATRSYWLYDAMLYCAIPFCVAGAWSVLIVLPVVLIRSAKKKA